MKIAIVGAGIAGNTAAYRLRREHEITVFEAADYVGGHTHTVDVEVAGQRLAVDTGFIVFNDWTYPRFVELLDELGVESQATSMSFSVSYERTGLEYNGTSLGALLATAVDVSQDTVDGTATTVQMLYLVSENLWGAGNLFFGLWLIPMGSCVLSSGRMPRASATRPAASSPNMWKRASSPAIPLSAWTWKGWAS